MNIKFLHTRIHRNASIALMLMVLVASFITGSLPVAYAQRASSPGGSSFFSDFGNTHDGWTPVFGLWKLNNAVYTTNGTASATASVQHTGTYGDFTYEASLRRSDKCTTKCGDLGLLVRGNPSVLGTWKDWLPGYWFAYTNSGWFHVLYWKSDGTYNTLQGWTSSTAILKTQWNKLKVVASGSSLAFYINGTNVWSGTDADSPTGQVGIGFYKNPDGGNISIDWAQLSIGDVTPLDFTPLVNSTGVVAPGTEVSGGTAHQSP